jgi:hypothetical protein
MYQEDGRKMVDGIYVALLAYLSARAAVDRLIVADVANTYATRLGPAPYSQLVSELQHRHHAELELIYLTAAECLGLEGLQVPAFNDPLLYAGAPRVRHSRTNSLPKFTFYSRTVIS